MRAKLKTVKKINYKMVLHGKEYTIPEVTFTVSPFDGKLTISVAEFKRINRWFLGKK